MFDRQNRPRQSSTGIFVAKQVRTKILIPTPRGANEQIRFYRNLFWESRCSWKLFTLEKFLDTFIQLGPLSGDPWIPLGPFFSKFHCELGLQTAKKFYCNFLEADCLSLIPGRLHWLKIQRLTPKNTAKAVKSPILLTTSPNLFEMEEKRFSSNFSGVNWPPPTPGQLH